MLRPLGSLTALKIWHDNSGGTGDDSSWYLKHVIVHDVQTREKFYFICENWLDIDKKDSPIERFLPISLEREKTRFRYLLSKKTKEKLSNDHLWLSIFVRPVQSSFTRLDRLTCCFVLLSTSMLMNILYYGMDDNSSSTDGLQIGPYVKITQQQISIGLMINLILVPPTILLVQLFRRVKPRRSHLYKLKTILNTKEANCVKKKPSFELRFPWWFKIVAYVISFVFAGVSLFFVIARGIEFGDAKVTKWLTSLIISFFSSVLITQPLQVRKEKKTSIFIWVYFIFKFLKL